MPQHSSSQQSMISVPLKITEALLTAGLTYGGPFYLVYEHASQRFQVVWWERLRWQCSCNHKKCIHMQAVSASLLEESYKNRMSENDLAAHVEDELGLNS